VCRTACHCYLCEVKGKAAISGGLFGVLWQFDNETDALLRSVVQPRHPKLLLLHPFNNRTAAMSALATLKLVSTKQAARVSPTQQRRNKMLKRVHEQIELARSEATNTPFVAVKMRTIKDSATGLRTQVQSSKRVKAWWFDAGNGKLALSVRYGARTLELGKGKWAVEVATRAELVPTLEIVQSAVEAGELDSQLEACAGSLRKGFGK
jgi:hypothetical protein